MVGNPSEKPSPTSTAETLAQGVRAIHIPTLLELLMLGARDQPVSISTRELAKRIGKSQQLASRHLKDLERGGFVVRVKSDHRHSVKLTEKGLKQLMWLHSMLKESLEALPASLQIEGEVFTGLGEGAYYMSIGNYRLQFKEKLGFDPYLGTLNLNLTTPKDRRVRQDLEHHTGIRIEPFKDEHRTYGGAKCFFALVNDVVEGVVILLDRTHYNTSALEVISPVHIRKKLGLKDGDRVKVEVFLSPERSPKAKAPL